MGGFFFYFLFFLSLKYVKTEVIPCTFPFFAILTNDNLCNVKSGGSYINFTSWNVKCLNSAIKCSKVLSHLQYLNTHIGFLQETRLKKLRSFQTL